MLLTTASAKSIPSCLAIFAVPLSNVPVTKHTPSWLERQGTYTECVCLQQEACAERRDQGSRSCSVALYPNHTNLLDEQAEHPRTRQECAHQL